MPRVHPLRKLSFLALCLGVSVRAEPPISGRIDRIESISVLRVFGTPHEMGWAHGFLLADEIASYVNACVKAFFDDDPQKYAEAVGMAARLSDLPAAAKAELEGVLAGIREAKPEVPQVKVAGRPIALDDLILLNSMDAVRAFACSGFTVWGDAAGGAGVITGRNFDFGIIDPSAPTGQILVRSPNGRHAVASVVPPGYIGSFTGVSDQGVCTFMHDGDGPQMRSPAGRFTPLAITLTELLESADAGSAMTLAEGKLKAISPYPFSYMARIVAPRVPGRIDAPARVFRIDASGLSENEIESGAMTCLTTNHYLPTAEEPPDNWSITRYGRLTDMLKGTVTSELAWKVLDAVAADQPSNLTLHSLVVFPEQRRLEIAFAGVKGKLTPAPENKPIGITFDQLFATSTARPPAPGG